MRVEKEKILKRNRDVKSQIRIPKSHTGIYIYEGGIWSGSRDSSNQIYSDIELMRPDEEILKIFLETCNKIITKL